MNITTKGNNQRNSQEMSREEKKRGFRIHRNVYCCVMGILTTVNMIFVPEFMWFIFPLIGWGAGLSLHYFLAIKRDL